MVAWYHWDMDDAAMQNSKVKTQNDDSGQARMTTDDQVGTGLKEQGSHMVQEAPETQDLVMESSPEMKLSPEVVEAGVEAKNEAPVILKEHEQVGLQHAGATVPVQIPQDLKAWPLTKQQAQAVIAVHKKVKESVTWLAMLILKQFKVAERKSA